MKRGAGAVTVDDVAAHAGVSIKTVSRVLNHEPNISEKTRQKVVEAMQVLDYRPNPAARRLASKRADIIALVYDNPSDNYIVNIQHGALEACQALDYSLLLSPCNYRDPHLAEQMIQSVRQRALAGLILTPPVSDVPALIHALDEAGVDYVRLAPADREHKGLSVHTEDRAAARDMTLHLIGLGHRRIGFVVCDPDHGAAYSRVFGYRDAMAQAGIAVDERLVEQGQHSFESGMACAERLLAHEPRPTAIFAGNDDMAAGVLRVAQAHGIRVPEELSIAGYDDTPLSRQLWPSLTTVRQPIQDMAYAAVEQLIAIHRPHLPGLRPHSEHESLQYELVIRDSTCPPPR
ncbi:MULTISPECIES: LacI family DNA-binding transcriptional regulator [Ralstonia solanacearum species complex]|nr:MULTISPECIES: LacI family DNA-binding transcriptional regulator [Ralstonia]AKZ29368.1 LacI family transcriptional regulator [Ralstonia solanacearum]APF89969.1 LacI family transcriptional regulator [Ralstonia solanacearum FJAT-1458]ARS59432.1 LacI family transcriptional regulator [Ralstonia solanacearum FJAT-91]AVV67710.1 LacI family DNA-binding transcriptional regulator [Ralstonia solanacearum OE1-1]ANH35196.1 LacI family transcription regulator [Ralstonia solanacearum]